MVALPICELCASTGVLCSGCQQRLSKGLISQSDADASRVISKLASQHELSKVKLIKAIDLGKMAVLVVKGDAGALIGRAGAVANEISKGLGKKVRIAEDSGDVRKTLSDILSPARVLGINKVFSSGGASFSRVRIAKADLRALPSSVEILEKALSEFLGTQTQLSFE